ncbi:MAG: hypothetical protein RLZZ09_1954 [Pseudomonadota bacterium]
MTACASGQDWRIKINGMGHGGPHVHIEFRDGFRVSVAMKTREILAGGGKPAHRLRAALTNIESHETTYLNEYRRLNP